MRCSLSQLNGSHAEPSADGPDEDAWQFLTAAIIAANREDCNGMAMHIREFEALGDDKFDAASRYLWYLLRIRVVYLLRRRPTAEDRHGLASRTYPRYRQVIRESVITLEDTLRAYFKLAPVGSPPTAGRFFVAVQRAGR
jgi:hypothetical protein